MKPVIEDTKIDKITQENFEAIRNVLCGNVSLDNMSLRVLEGTTKESDTQNLVIHSGNSRPVGWFPLVGDVYVQEIDDKYIDIRSTKPEVNFKILVLFGPPITSESLKAVGGDNYADTPTVIEQTVINIQPTEETIVDIQPLLTVSTSLGRSSNGTNVVQKVATDGDYFYFFVRGSADRLHRYNRETGAYDNLQLVGATELGVGYYKDGYIYVSDCNQLSLQPVKIWKIDISTFTVTTYYGTAWNNAANSAQKNISDIYVDDLYIYTSGHSTNAFYPVIVRYTIATGVQTYIRLATASEDTNERRPVRILHDTLYGIPYFILPIADTSSNKVRVVMINSSGAWNRTIGAAEVWESPAGRWYFRNAVYSGTSVYMAVHYSTDVTGASTEIFSQAILKFGCISKTFEVIPLSGTPVSAMWTGNMILSDGYIYMAYGRSNELIKIIRYDTFDDTFALGMGVFCNNFSTVAGTIGEKAIRDNLLCLDTDGSILVTDLSPGSSTSNAAYARLDFIDQSS